MFFCEKQKSNVLAWF